MKKLSLLVPAIACVCQGIAAERFTVNAEDLVSNNTTCSTFSKYVTTEWDTTHADKIILKRVSRTQVYDSTPSKEFELIFSGKFNNKKLEFGDEAFNDICVSKMQNGQKICISDNIFLNIKCIKAEDGTPVKILNGKDLFTSSLSVKSIDFSGADTSNVTDMSFMFCGCSNLESLDLGNFNTSNVTDMRRMFGGCSELKSLDLSNFDTKNVTDMQEMFWMCKQLIYLNLSKFDTSNVTNMQEMFRNCHNLTSLDVSNFNTSNVTDMSSMFSYCYNLTSLNLSNFNTSNVTIIYSMFENCKSLAIINFEKFNAQKVWNMSTMFRGCQNLSVLSLGDTRSKNTEGQDKCDKYEMFEGCTHLMYHGMK